ncbi:MAG TPA: glycosyltransferase family 4 protein [Candidatus Saccharimonadia bacterium]|nr:glycosyltransferase family 4 protein [Candidatus Saccharimonadia bacterium]
MNSNKHARLRLTFFSFGILEQGGGFENYLLTTARGLADHYGDLEISIVTMSPEIVEKLQHLLTIYFMRVQKPTAIYRETYESIQAKLGDVAYIRANSLKELRMLLQQADVIYSKNEVLELAVLNRIGMRKLPPVILGVHTPIYYPHTPSPSAKLHNLLYMGPLYRRLIKRVWSIQVNNADDLKLVQQKLKFSNVRVVRQAIDIPSFKDALFDGSTLKVLFVGRLTEAKGVGLLIETIVSLHRANRDAFSVKIAGSGDAAIVRQIQQLARRIPEVQYLGHVEHKNISELYDWADATIITSNYETLNKVAIETALAGKIAVCPDIPGPREIIEDGVSGFLLPRTAAAFVECLTRLAALKLEDPTQLREMGEAAYIHVKQEFNAGRVYLDMYQELLTIAKGSYSIAA